MIIANEKNFFHRKSKLNKFLKKEFLDKLYIKYESKYSSKDPVWILHEFQDEKDIEIAALITSSYAYGQIEKINSFVNKFFGNINFKVYEFTSNFSQQKDKKFLKGLYYRFNTENDLALLLNNIKDALLRSGTLQNMFLENYRKTDTNIIPALTHFSEKLNKRNNKNSFYNYLIPNPAGNSACKRLNLFLRWLVRKDKIDLGIWDMVDKSKLIMPVDTHVYKTASILKLARRKSCDLKFAVKLTDCLKKFDVSDPVKYDFALCHIGIDKLKI